MIRGHLERALLAAGLAAAALSACHDAVVDPEPGERWGGQHIAVDVTANGAQLTFDCATGSIDQPIAPDPDGRFSLPGGYLPGTGGPTQAPTIPVGAEPARWEGRIQGDRMELVGVLVERGDSVGPFTARRGAEAVIYSCLGAAGSSR